MTQSLRVCICVLSALGRVQSPLTQIVANLSAPGKIDPLPSGKLWSHQDSYDRNIRTFSFGPWISLLSLTHQPLWIPQRIMTIVCGLCPSPCEGKDAVTTGSDNLTNRWTQRLDSHDCHDVIHSELLICVAALAALTALAAWPPGPTHGIWIQRRSSSYFVLKRSMSQ